MKAMNVKEVEDLGKYLQTLEGCAFNNFVVHKNLVGLGFWGGDGLKWVFGDLSANSPILVPVEKLPVRFGKKISPVKLFVSAHMIGKALTSVKYSCDMGRIILLEFGESSQIYTMELRLFPHGQNILVSGGGKQISMNKPKYLSRSEDFRSEGEVREFDQILRQWREERADLIVKTKKSEEVGEGRDRRLKAIKKKKKAIQLVEEDLQVKRQSPWRAVGQWISAHRSLDVPVSWRKHVDDQKSVDENVNRCFENAKKMEKKAERTDARLVELYSELEVLDGDKDQSQTKFKREAEANRKSLLSQAKARGRSLKMKSGLEFFVGKAAKDNLAIIRKARAWDLWFHLKDFSSCHGVLRREKKYRIRETELYEAGEFLIQMNFGEKIREMVGEKYEVMFTEIRYVRPIKGDRVGRVNYSHEKVFTVKVKGR